MTPTLEAFHTAVSHTQRALEMWCCWMGGADLARPDKRHPLHRALVLCDKALERCSRRDVPHPLTKETVARFLAELGGAVPWEWHESGGMAPPLPLRAQNRRA